MKRVITVILYCMFCVILLKHSSVIAFEGKIIHLDSLLRKTLVANDFVFIESRQIELNEARFIKGLTRLYSIVPNENIDFVIQSVYKAKDATKLRTEKWFGLVTTEIWSFKNKDDAARYLDMFKDFLKKRPIPLGKQPTTLFLYNNKLVFVFSEGHINRPHVLRVKSIIVSECLGKENIEDPAFLENPQIY